MVVRTRAAAREAGKGGVVEEDAEGIGEWEKRGKRDVDGDERRLAAFRA